MLIIITTDSISTSVNPLFRFLINIRRGYRRVQVTEESPLLNGENSKHTRPSRTCSVGSKRRMYGVAGADASRRKTSERISSLKTLLARRTRLQPDWRSQDRNYAAPRKRDLGHL